MIRIINVFNYFNINEIFYGFILIRLYVILNNIKFKFKTEFTNIVGSLQSAVDVHFFLNTSSFSDL